VHRRIAVLPTQVFDARHYMDAVPADDVPPVSLCCKMFQERPRTGIPRYSDGDRPTVPLIDVETGFVLGHFALVIPGAALRPEGLA
jgi:hypothetical protein